MLPYILQALSRPLRVYGNGQAITPSSVLTRPADTTAYAQNDLIANSTTAGLVNVPFFTAGVAGGSGKIRRIRLYSNLTTGGTTLQCRVEFWLVPPKLNAGDNGAYAITTAGANSFLGLIDTTIAQQWTDGLGMVGIPTTGLELNFVLPAGQSLIYWTLKEIDATGFTPIASQTFTLVPEIWQD